MNASELYQQGKLKEAIDAQVQAVKAKPADPGVRLFLFELLAFAGELDRAQKQIEAIQYAEQGLQNAQMEYQLLVAAERNRRRVFTEGIAPRFPEAPPEHAKLRLEALQQACGGNAQAARELIARADEAVPPLKGTLNGKPFDLLRDCDDRLGPILEVMVHGNYFWVPLDQVELIALEPPKYPRDLVWAPARLHTKQGTTGEVFLPALYPESYLVPDDQIKLGRLTDWTSADDGPVRGLGARTFLCGDDPVLLLEWRELVFADTSPPAEPASESGEAPAG